MEQPHRHFDPTNPEHLVYRNGMLQITILGGIRTDLSDRMRVR
jgi:hypothetical protein